MYGRRILILIPHPDDEVVGCCAAIGRARAQGSQVFGAYLTTGVPACEVFWPWQRAGHARRVARRRDEARQAAATLDIELLSFAEVPTRQLKSHIAPTLATVRDQICRSGADTLWTPGYEGGHQDHDAANFIASRLRADVNVWEFSEYNFFGGKVRSQEFVAPNGSEREIALTKDERRFKRKVLRLYASEKGNLSYVRTEREVFRPLTAYDYSRPPHTGRLFYQRFQWAIFQTRVDYTRPEEVCRALIAAARETEGTRD